MATKETKASKMGAAEKAKDPMAEALKEHGARIIMLKKCGGNGNGSGAHGTMVELKDKRLVSVDEFKKLYLNHNS
jgi:hypothetical protein